MQHVAIMNPKLKFIGKILTGEKTIETRWYKHRISPWNKLSKGDVIYFKDSGKDITAKAVVEKFEQFEDLNESLVREIVNKHAIGIGIEEGKKEKFIGKHLNKRYGILIWLKSPSSLTPFKINKKGFGNAAAWLTLENISYIVSNS